jgi:hypothetical protein
MNKPVKNFNQYRKNVFSQNGEDGVLAEILNRLQISTGSCVEFGAWDGKFLSNTYNLVKQGWQAIYIEGDATKYEDLKRTCAEHPNLIHPIRAFVGYDGANSLDGLLAPTKLARDFELLSIDVDSTDFQIWAALKNYQPKIVVIEINSSIEPGILQVHRDEHIAGSSFSSTLRLGREKGYRLVCHTGNMIFVEESLVPKLGLSPLELQAPELLFDYMWARPRPVKETPRWFDRIWDRSGTSANGSS